MQNDEMTKEMFNALQNIGVIAYYNPDQITFFENNEQKTYIFQLDNDRKYFENICDSNDNRVLENNIKTIYYTITNFKKIKTLLKNQPGAVKVIKKRFIEVIRKILSKMNTSGLNKKFIQFKINRSNITFNLMEQRIINGEEPIFEYTKTKKENELVFYDYYNDMLNKTALFYPTFETEQKNVEEILKFLREYIETNRPKTYSCVGYQKPSKLWNKVSIAINLKEFLSNNVDSALYNWWEGISSKRKVDSIMRKSWKTYKKNTDLKEWLTAFENKINNENEPEKCKTIKNFIDQLEYHKDKLPKKKITKDITEILSNILTSNSFNNFITNEYVKNIFNERYNKFSHIRRRKGGFTPYDIYNSYPDEMKIAYNKVMKTSKAFLSIVHSKNNNYSNELKNTLLNYSNSIEKLANDELEKYYYFYKFITNEAIVPAGFWDNKILYK